MKPINLINHPEGGKFSEVFRSNNKVMCNSKNRSALTHIYFSLKKNEISKFHRVKSDEIWNLYEGNKLTLYMWDENLNKITLIELSSKNREYCHVIPAGVWQAAYSEIENALVGCSVAPGFEFEDFELMNMGSAEAKMLLSKYPEYKKLIAS